MIFIFLSSQIINNLKCKNQNKISKRNGFKFCIIVFRFSPSIRRASLFALFYFLPGSENLIILPKGKIKGKAYQISTTGSIF